MRGRILRPDTKLKAEEHENCLEEDDFCVQIKVTILLIYADAGIYCCVPLFLALCILVYKLFPFFLVLLRDLFRFFLFCARFGSKAVAKTTSIN